MYEARVPVEPTIPWEIVSNRTSASAYAAIFIHSIAVISIVYYLPVYFQAVLSSSPLHAGVQVLPTSLVISPFAMLSSLAVQLLGRYIPSNALGWVLVTVGFGLMSLLKAGDSIAHWIGYQILVSAGIGTVYPGTIFPILAPLPVEKNATAMAFYAFLRNFGQTWGITIAGTILQNGLLRRLPASFTSALNSHSGHTELAFAAIPVINQLPEPMRTQVREAFASSLSDIWKTMIGFGGAGLITVFFLKEIKMHEVTDERFGMKEKEDIDTAKEKGAVPTLA